MVGVYGRVRTAWGKVARAVAVVALVVGATMAAATAAEADQPWGSEFTPQDGNCTSTLSDADCWHYARTFGTQEDCRVFGLAVTFGYAGSVQCLVSQRDGNTDLWIWRSEGQCPAAGVNVDQCRGGLRAGDFAWWTLPTPIGGG